MRVSLAEFQEPWVKLLNFFVADPSKEVNVRQLVGRLDHLEEPCTIIISTITIIIIIIVNITVTIIILSIILWEG